MANPICLSPLKFYDDASKQNHRKAYAYNNICPLLARLQFIPSFQFVIPSNLYIAGGGLGEAYIRDAKTNYRVTGDISQELIESGFSIQTISGYIVVLYAGSLPVQFTTEGLYYLELVSSTSGVWAYYSEVFCFTNSFRDLLKIEYWSSCNLYLKNGIVTFPDGFKFTIFLRTELGKPEYNFEEEATKRLGYTFIESQVSKKVYKFSSIIPEYLCDAMRIIRLCDNKHIENHGEEYEAITFEIDVSWQTQGDLASVSCEFETDNIMVNLAEFEPDLRGGDFNSDYNNDFNN